MEYIYNNYNEEILEKLKITFDAGDPMTEDGEQLIPQYVELLFEWMYHVVHHHWYERTYLTLAIKLEEYERMLHDRVTELVQNDVDATELLSVWNTCIANFEKSVDAVESAKNMVGST